VDAPQAEPRAGSGAASASGAAGAPTADPPVPPAAQDEPQRGQATPRDAAFTFIVLARDGEWESAARILEKPAAGWPGGERPERIARALKRVLDQRLWLDFARVPGAEANRSDGAWRVSLGTVEARGTTLDVSLVRTPGGWMFAASTVEGVPSMARALGMWWVVSLPSMMSDVRVAEIELWQWIGLALIVSVGVAAGWTVSRSLRRGARLDALQRLGPVAQSVVAVAAPLGVLLSLLAMRLAQPLLGLSAPARENLALGSRALTLLTIAWAVARWLRIVTAAIEHQMERRGIADATSIVRVGRVVATGLVWLLGVAAALQTFGLDLSAVIAGLGIGTAAIALASQQTLGNLFGGASLVADRVVHPGDLVTVNGVTGTVERIGIRSTHLRTADCTLVVVANGDLAQSRIEKLSGRSGFRYVTTLGLLYETPPAAIRTILSELRARLAAEPLVDREQLFVHFVSFGQSSLDVDVRAVFRTEDFAAYRAAVERVNLDFIDIVNRNGSGFAFPSRTVYVVDGDGQGVEAPGVRRTAGAAGG
jgi:MscS family membrane protein